MIWLSFSLQEKELSIKRLRKIFGIKTESAKKLLELAHGKSLQQNNSVDGNSGEDDSKGKDFGDDDSEDENKETGLNNDPGKDGELTKKKTKNHGHRSSADYSEAKIFNVAHQTLKKGDVCPDCLKGKVFQLKPGATIRIVGQPWLQIEIYCPELGC